MESFLAPSTKPTQADSRPRVEIFCVDEIQPAPIQALEVLAAFLDAVLQHLRCKEKRVLGLASVTEAFPRALTAIRSGTGWTSRRRSVP